MDITVLLTFEWWEFNVTGRCSDVGVHLIYARWQCERSEALLADIRWGWHPRVRCGFHNIMCLKLIWKLQTYYWILECSDLNISVWVHMLQAPRSSCCVFFSSMVPCAVRVRLSTIVGLTGQSCALLYLVTLSSNLQCWICLAVWILNVTMNMVGFW